MTPHRFLALLDDLAAAWARRDYAAAADRFTPDVRYGDPLRYAFTSRGALLEFFQADEGYPQRTTWHTRLFDEARQLGVAEYTYEGTHRYHGVALIRVSGDLVSHWREYQHTDPRGWEDFSAGTAGL